jgi:hypothetical protein
MAKGDYILFNNVPFQRVTSPKRRYGVMFNPSSSLSRLRIRDSGRRYSVRLREGVVEYSTDGDATWNPIDSFADPCTGKKLPKMVTHERLRTGEELSSIVFDMIAVGRGRIIAKEKDTDRLFHLYIDEMFRTHTAFCNSSEGGNRPVPQEGGDPPIPPFNMKLDPEYFTLDPPTVIVPPEGTRDYAGHPASLRLPVFNQLLELDASDVMLVLERARTWYLKDTRSQLEIRAQEDFGFGEQDLIDVFSEAALLEILDSIKKAAEKMIDDNWFAKFLFDRMFDINKIAHDWHQQIVDDGFGVLIFPAYVALGVLLYGARNSHALKSEPGGKLLMDPAKFLQFTKQPVGNPNAKPFIDKALTKFGDLISQLMLLSRRAALQRYEDRGDVHEDQLPPTWTIENKMPTPNQPTAWLPVIVRTSYVKRSGPWRGTWQRFYGLPDEMQKVWLARNANGTLEAFAMTLTEVVMHTTQPLPNGDWDGAWSPLVNAFDRRRDLTIVSNTDGRLELFGISPEQRTWHTSQSAPNGRWLSTWDELYSANDLRLSISAEVNLDGRLEVFGIAKDNTVWRTAQTSPGTWSKTWEQTYTSDFKLRDVWLAKNADGTLEAFGVDLNTHIWRTAQSTPGGKWNGTWSELYSDADHLRSLAIGRHADGRLEIFGAAPDNTVWRSAQESPGKWPTKSNWSMLYSPADLIRDLWVISNIDGRLEVFGVSPDNFVWHTWQDFPNGPFNGTWQQIDTGDARRNFLAAAPNADGTIELIGVSTDILSLRPWRLRLVPEKRYAIQYSQVLDIGIGSSHWSENWQTHFGGEIHALLAPRPLFQGERYSLTQYRFLNGPVIDGDAFNDGTTNFYMLVKLGPPGSTGAGLVQRYAILWFDEQTYFTQRWRLVHPTDDILGDLFSLQHYLRDNPEWYDFQLAKYWDPFRAFFIDDDSRMIVRRNVIVVTGRDPGENRYEIYTIVFNYGLCDHSWRWRKFPDGKQVLIDADKAQDQDPQLPDEVTNGSEPAYVVVNTIDLRDDTMLTVRGSRRIGGTLRTGRWVQRYLPADCQHVPERHALTGRKPAVGFSHPWDFLSDLAFKRADQFYQFGVYEDLIDSRAQYYEIDLLPGANGVTPQVADVVNHVWRNDSGGLRGDQLKHNTIQFNWALPKENGAIVRRMSEQDDPMSPELFVHQFRKRGTMSMYEPTTRFRIIERKPLGLIAVFYDKRDDELQPASDLPQPTTFVQNDEVESQIPDTWKTADGEVTPLLPRPPAPSIRVMVRANHRVYQPPNVRKAWMQIDKAPGLRRLHVSFWTPQMEHDVNVNIWKVSLAAIDENGHVVPMFSVLRFGTFVRRAVPQAPLPLGFRDPLGDEWRYDWDWNFGMEIQDNVRRFCTPEGHLNFATSLWFEDIVGHRALAEELVIEPLAQDLGAQDLGVVVDGLPTTAQ